MPQVFRLGYVTLGTPDVARARSYYMDVLGLREVERGADGTSYLSIGLDHHEVVLCPAATAGLVNFGYQLVPGATLDAFARHVRGHGLIADLKSDAQPGIPAVLEVQGPGGALQFYERMEAPAPSYGRAGIVPTRLGHAAVISLDAAALARFYDEVLGFWTTDWIEDVATFMTCNRDHHVVNVVQGPVSGLHHLAFELTGRAHQFDAAEMLRQAGIGIVWGPSRHTAGHNLASYHYDPDGVLIELYTDLDVFVPELGYCEPRPWHEELPMRPRRWPRATLSAWDTRFEFNFGPRPPA